MEINSVYEHLVKAFDIRIKAQVVGSGLRFEKLLDVRDIVTGQKYHLLVVNGIGLEFTNMSELITRLIKRIEMLRKEIEGELAELDRHERDDLVVDENAMFYAKEDLSVREGKLDQLMRRLVLLIEKTPAAQRSV
jgi:hypothetical protein